MEGQHSHPTQPSERAILVPEQTRRRIYRQPKTLPKMRQWGSPSTVVGWIEGNMVYQITRDNSRCGYCDWCTCYVVHRKSRTPSNFHIRRPLHKKPFTQKTLKAEPFYTRGDSNHSCNTRNILHHTSLQYNQMQVYQKTFTPKSSYAKLLLQQNMFTPGTFCTRKPLTCGTFGTKSFLHHQALHQNRYAPKSLYARKPSKYTRKPLQKGPVAPEAFDRGNLNQKPLTQKKLLNQKPLTPKNLLQQTTFTPTGSTQKPVYSKKAFTPKSFTPNTIFTRSLLHQKPFYARSCLTRSYFTRSFYTRNLLHQNL